MTHGLPESSPRPFSEPSIASSPPLRASRQAPSAVENAGSTASGTSFSTTNNQEPGIEEPDIVKTDGSTIFAVEQGTLYAVAAGGPAPHLAGSIPLGSTGYGAQLLLRGSRVLVISGSGPLPLGVRVGVAAPAVPAAAGSRSPALHGDPPTSLARSRAPIRRAPSIAPSPY